MRAIVLSILIVVCCVACNSKDKVPSDIIQPEKMKEVLWDMMRADQFVSDYVVVKNPSIDIFSESVSLYQTIFNLHAITQEKFKRSFIYYQSHPYLIEEIMNAISTESEKSDTIQKLPFDSTLLKDSNITLDKQQHDTGFRRLRRNERMHN